MKIVKCSVESGSTKKADNPLILIFHLNKMVLFEIKGELNAINQKIVWNIFLYFLLPLIWFEWFGQEEVNGSDAYTVWSHYRDKTWAKFS